jgi:hypothetical protein
MNNSSQLNMFWEIILPIFRSTRLYVTACGVMHPRCCRPVAGNIVGYCIMLHTKPMVLTDISDYKCIAQYEQIRVCNFRLY